MPSGINPLFMATIIVAYASKGGATAEIAGWIGDALRRTGATVDVRPADDVASLEGFDAVVVGGPLYMGKVLKPVPAFFSRHRAALAGKPVAVFISGSSLGKDDSKADQHGQTIAEAAAGGRPYRGGRALRRPVLVPECTPDRPVPHERDEGGGHAEPGRDRGLGGGAPGLLRPLITPRRRPASERGRPSCTRRAGARRGAGAGRSPGAGRSRCAR